MGMEVCGCWCFCLRAVTRRGRCVVQMGWDWEWFGPILAIGPGFFGPTESTKMRPEAHPNAARTVSGRASHEAQSGPCFFQP